MATAGQLYRLARLLRDIALTVTSDPDEPTVPLSLVAVTDDIAHHGPTTVGEIATRTGLAQSLVSRTVVQLRDAGVCETSVDETDRRRTRIAITAAARSTVFAPRAERSITAALTEHLPDVAPDRIPVVEQLIDDLVTELAAPRPQR